MKNKWKQQAAVELGPPVGTDLWVWWHYSLFMLCNRHVADFMDDDTVSHALQKMQERVPLPYFDNRESPDDTE